MEPISTTKPPGWQTVRGLCRAYLNVPERGARGENLSIFKIRKGHPILCFERLRRSMVLLRLTVLRTVVASCHALEKGSLDVESLAAGSIEKFWKGEREGENLSIFKIRKGHPILCFERLRRSMVLLRLTVLRTVVASCHALEKGSLAVESLPAGSIEKFWKGEREGENLFQEVSPSHLPFSASASTYSKKLLSAISILAESRRLAI